MREDKEGRKAVAKAWKASMRRLKALEKLEKVERKNFLRRQRAEDKAKRREK